MKALFVFLLLTSFSFAQSTATREITGYFISPTSEPSELVVQGDEAIAFMSSRFLWSEKGEKKTATLKNVKFSCDKQAMKCSFVFKNN